MIEILQRSTITTKAYELNYANNPDLKKQYEKVGKELPEKSDEDIQKNVDDLAKYPIVYLNNVMIESTNINKLYLYNDEFVPKLTLEFSDPTNKLIDENFPVDNSIISIFKDSSNTSFMGIKMDFKVTDFTIIKGTKKTEKITFIIDAIINVDDFYFNDFESYKGTSFDVLKTICTNMGLGFATNITNTNDEQVWINPSNYKIEFLTDIIDGSYISDDTYLFGYLDFYYNFNYVDIEKQLSEDISEQKTLLENKQMLLDGKETEVPLILTNHPDKDNTNLKIDKYTIVNSSTNVNLTYGYKHIVNYYNKTNDEIKNYAIDSISNNDDSNKIIMKGNDIESDDLYNNMSINTWIGKIDTDNAHENYLHSMLQNKMNLQFLQKLKMKVRLQKMNFGLYRFQKVNVELYNLGKTVDKTNANEIDVNKQDNRENNSKKEIDKFEETIINKLSGEWLIIAINFIYDKSQGNIQEITLVKRELTDKYNFRK